MAITIEPSHGADRPVSLGPSLAGAARFRTLFAEGMALVEEAAAYLDGPGRSDADRLRAGLKGACSAESMRLTTRLMQIASWLLVRRATIDGHAPPPSDHVERTRVALSAQAPVTAPDVLAHLPEALQGLVDRSLRLQQRVLHLDRMVNATEDTAALAGRVSAVDRQIALLQSAFAPGR